MNATLCMRSLLHNHTISLSRVFAYIGAGLLLVTLFTSVVSARASDNKPSAGQRLITIHDAGQDRGLMTGATTLRAAFDEAGIALDKNDLIEPGLDEQLVANNYEVNVYRARPVMIVDGAVRQKVMTPYQTATQIAKTAGIELHDEDNTTITRSEDIVSDGSGLLLTIDRATPFNLVLYGKKIPAYTQSGTVGEMLASKKITLGKDDTLSVPASTRLTAGMSIEIWRNGKQTVTEEQVIAFDTEKIQDADHESGYKEVKTPGENGKKNVTYEIEMRNGVEVGRAEIQSITTQESKNQVEVVGTKVSLPSGSHEDWMAAAGIAPGDYGFVNYIVGKEGGWCPVRWQGDSGCVNHGSAPGGLGYGLVQATPGNKMVSAGADWLTNPITQLKWANGYAVGRYGSWSGAYNHWLSSHNW